MRPIIRNLLLNFSLAVGSIVCVVALGDIGLRLIGVQPGPVASGMYRSTDNDNLSYELIPHLETTAFGATVTTNAQGFRSPQIDSTKPLMAVLGDSMTFGYGVADGQTLPAALQKLLPRHFVLNAAVPGYGLRQEAATYREKITPLNPAALMLVFYFNDLTDESMFLDSEGILRPKGWSKDTATCDRLHGILRMLPGQCWLAQHSAIYQLTKTIVNRRAGKQWVKEERERAQKDPERESIDQNKLRLYAAEFHELANDLPEDLARVFVIWPDQNFHIGVRKILRTLAETHGFLVVDLYDIFGNNVPLLGRDHVHPAAEAMEKAAAYSAEKMLQEKILQ